MPHVLMGRLGEAGSGRSQVGTFEGNRRPSSMAISEKKETEEEEPQDIDVDLDPEAHADHDWHFRYNRRLGCFSQSVCTLTFSPDGDWLVSGTGGGDVKVWDANTWAEASKLRGGMRKESKALVISPSQRWLVSAYSSVLHIFQFQEPWRLVHTLPPPCDTATKESFEWACVAFAPMAEVDHPGGHTGQDNHLAAFSTGQLCVFDYSGGWNVDTPRRTRSLMQSGKPKTLAYTESGWWMVCGFGNGMLQIWNAFSLTLEKTVSGHSDAVNSLTSSPRGARYESRLVSCGIDQTLRVWHSCGWVLEQHVHDHFCDRAGVRTVSFSATGNWLVSVSTELSVWRVCITMRGRFFLRLHQRLATVCGSEGMRSAAFGTKDEIAVGSRDGVLGLWTKFTGKPTMDPMDQSMDQNPYLNRSDSQGSVSWQRSGPLPRPMQRLTPEGIKPLANSCACPRARQPSGEWFQQTRLRSFSTSNLGSRTGSGNLTSLSAVSTAGRVVVGSDGSSPSQSPNSTLPSTPHPLSPMAQRNRLDRLQRIKPDTMRWKRDFDFGEILSQVEGRPVDRELKRCQSEGFRRKDQNQEQTLFVPDSPVLVPEQLSPVRKNMQNACRGIVKRMTLEPMLITDNLENST